MKGKSSEIKTEWKGVKAERKKAMKKKDMFEHERMKNEWEKKTKRYWKEEGMKYGKLSREIEGKEDRGR